MTKLLKWFVRAKPSDKPIDSFLNGNFRLLHNIQIDQNINLKIKQFLLSFSFMNKEFLSQTILKTTQFIDKILIADIKKLFNKITDVVKQK